MSLLSHIERCNVCDPDQFLPFHTDGARVGWVHRDMAGRLAAISADVTVQDCCDGWVMLTPERNDFDGRTESLGRIVAALAEDGWIGRMRGEQYAVTPAWGADPVMAIDRGAVPAFGIRSFGVHLNGLVRRDGELMMWVARRAEDRPLAPGKLDNVVAGGQSIGYSPGETLFKEGWEEAGLTPDVLANAHPAGLVSYTLQTDEGLRADTLFIYDLEMPESVTPRNEDGEVAGFELWPVEQVLATVEEGCRFKFNVNLVLIDFFIRHGLISPERPDYMALAQRLRSPVL